MGDTEVEVAKMIVLSDSPRGSPSGSPVSKDWDIVASMRPVSFRSFVFFLSEMKPY